MDFQVNKHLQIWTSSVALAYSSLFLYLILESRPSYRLTLRFNAIGEGPFEIVLLTFTTGLALIHFINTAYSLKNS